MKPKQLFCGIFLHNGKASVSVIDPKGRPVLSCQYTCEFPQEHFVEILDHLMDFANINRADLRIAYADPWDGPFPLDPLSTLADQVLRIANRDLSMINLVNPRSASSPDGPYDKPKIIALLGALRFKTSQTLADPSPFQKQAA